MVYWFVQLDWLLVYVQVATAMLLLVLSGPLKALTYVVSKTSLKDPFAKELNINSPPGFKTNWW